MTGSQESVRSGVRPRLQRQMAQSRKTFRFRKSKHGQQEVSGGCLWQLYGVFWNIKLPFQM